MVAGKGMKGLVGLLYATREMRQLWYSSELGCWSCNPQDG